MINLTPYEQTWIDVLNDLKNCPGTEALNEYREIAPEIEDAARPVIRARPGGRYGAGTAGDREQHGRRQAEHTGREELNPVVQGGHQGCAREEGEPGRCEYQRVRGGRPPPGRAVRPVSFWTVARVLMSGQANEQTGPLPRHDHWLRVDAGGNPVEDGRRGARAGWDPDRMLAPDAPAYRTIRSVSE
ncbi:hypothetical protein [Streptomyces smaragdinus]|uniref:hypothetical protein n=1 Tax=Streptomyces smaragdinus TaxID=2585196 RepID=UPI001297148C|nr:hypothetical protein [Streptomyces smaragdinus]